MKIINEYDLTAIHEAGHFIAEVLYCAVQIKGVKIEHVSIEPNKDTLGHVRRMAMTPEFFNAMKNMKIQGGTAKQNRALRSYYKLTAEMEIKQSLAGYASELLIIRNIDNFKKISRLHWFDLGILLKSLCDAEHGEYGDINMALSYNIAIGNQEPGQGAELLLKPFRAVLRDLLPYMDEIKNVAAMLEEKETIQGAELEQLIEDFTDRVLKDLE